MGKTENFGADNEKVALLNEISNVKSLIKSQKKNILINEKDFGVNYQDIINEFNEIIKIQSESYELQQKEIDAIGKVQAVIEFKMDGTIVNANENFLNVMGYTIDEIKGKHHSIFVEESYKNSNEYKEFWKKLNEGLYDAALYKRIGKNGKEVWIQSSYNPILDLNGKPFKVIKYATDITQEKLRNADFEGQIAAIGKAQAVIEFKMDGTIVNANDNFLNVLGYKLDEIKGKHHSMFVEDGYRNSREYKDFWKKLNDGEYDAGIYKRIGKNGKEVWIQSSYNPILDLNGNPFKVVKYATDITEQRLRNADFEGQIEAIGRAQAVIEFKMDGTIVNANENFLKVVGYTLDEVKGKHHSMFVEDAYRNSKDYKDFWKRLNDGIYDAAVYKRIGKNGKEVWIQSSYNPIFDLNGNPFKVVKYATDITEQRQKAIEISMIKAAHDNASTNIVMADNNFKIIFLNESIKKMFRQYQSEFQKVFSRFDSINLIGQNIDVFHVEPFKNKNILTNLTGIHYKRIKIGPLTFDLSLSKAKNEDGEFVGYAAEWVDVTQQVVAEEKVTGLVQAMLGGELDKRINTDGLSGFLYNIAAGLNDILNTITEPIMDIKNVVTKIGEGDLTIKTRDVYRGDFLPIKKDFDNALNNLNKVLDQTKSTVAEVSYAASQIRSTSHSVATGAQQQSSAIQESSSSLVQTSNMVKANAENANIAKQLVSETAVAANTGQEKMKEMISSMDLISKSSGDISKIIKVIDEIAFQTNLLALNAAVEAARAGKYGKGFAVVAKEVRNLAERSAQAAKETSELIEGSSKKVEQGVNITQATASSLSQIVINVIKVKDLVSEIATASDEQNKGINEVNKAMAQINQATQSNSQQSVELASASEQLGKQTDSLSKVIQQFKLKEKHKTADQSINLPDGVTMDMLNKIIGMLQLQKAHVGLEHTNSEANSNYSVYDDPKKVLPLDEDERGYHGF